MNLALVILGVLVIIGLAVALILSDCAGLVFSLVLLWRVPLRARIVQENQANALWSSRFSKVDFASPASDTIQKPTVSECPAHPLLGLAENCCEVAHVGVG